MTLTSTAFADGEPIPRKHTGDGADLSPPLAWGNLPDGTVELALICDDPDAPSPQPWVHWVIYKIPSEVAGMPEGLPRQERLPRPVGTIQGVNSWSSGSVGYRGPAPPPGKIHHYHFTLYALDEKLDAPGGLTKDQLTRRMDGHVLAQTLLMGTYKR